MDAGTRVASLLKKSDIICLFGDLGSGKTTLVKGIARGLKINPKTVNSPTFVLMNIYQGKLPLYHFDLYRIETVQEMFFLDYEEYLYGEGVAVIEWAQRLGALLPAECLKIELAVKGEHERSISLTPLGKRYEERFKSFKV